MDDTAAIIGADVQVRAEHAMALNDTKSKENAGTTDLIVAVNTLAAVAIVCKLAVAASLTGAYSR